MESLALEKHCWQRQLLTQPPRLSCVLLKVNRFKSTWEMVPNWSGNCSWLQMISHRLLSSLTKLMHSVPKNMMHTQEVSLRFSVPSWNCLTSWTVLIRGEMLSLSSPLNRLRAVTLPYSVQIHTSRMSLADDVNLEEFVITKDEFSRADNLILKHFVPKLVCF